MRQRVAHQVHPLHVGDGAAREIERGRLLHGVAADHGLAHADDGIEALLADPLLLIEGLREAGSRLHVFVDDPAARADAPCDATPESVEVFAPDKDGNALILAKPRTTVADADALYAELTAAGLEVLYDDRDESPGVKFNDADLIGLPLRLTASSRNHKAGVVEVLRRAGGDPDLVPRAEVASRVLAARAELLSALG